MSAEVAEILPPEWESPSGFWEVDREADWVPEPPTISLWDEIAIRWPPGGRFPSLISIDQS